MKATTLLIAALSTLASAQSVPDCATACLASPSGNGCASTDLSCLCTDPTYLAASTKCIMTSCSAGDQIAAGQAATALCASVGVTINPDAAPAPASSTPAAETPASTTSSAVVLPASTPVETPETTASTAASTVIPAAATTTVPYSNGTVPTAGLWASNTTVVPYAGGAGRNDVLGVVGLIAVGVLFL